MSYTVRAGDFLEDMSVDEPASCWVFFRGFSVTQQGCQDLTEAVGHPEVGVHWGVPHRGDVISNV